LKLISTLFGVPLQLPVSGEFGAALGGARLGLIAATGVSPESVITSPEIQDEVHPDGGLSGAFEEAYQTFRSAYPGLKKIQ
jgi:xylulokinase